MSIDNWRKLASPGGDHVLGRRRRIDGGNGLGRQQGRAVVVVGVGATDATIFRVQLAVSTV